MPIPVRSLTWAAAFITLPALTAIAAPTRPSLCASDEQAAFTCPLNHSHKIVSLCLAPGAAKPPAARYVFGTMSHLELVYPSSGMSSTDFMQAHLSYAGATGGNAYSFVTNSTKYVVYQVSGTGFDDAGVIVQHVGSIRSFADLKCRPDTAADAVSFDAFTRIKTWKPDPDLNGRNLPDPR